MTSELHFDRGGQSAHDIERATAMLWAELAFDDHAKSALKRDGLVLNGLRLTGPSPFIVHEIQNDNERYAVSAEAADASHREALLALWQVHFLKRLQSGLRRATAAGAPEETGDQAILAPGLRPRPSVLASALRRAA